MRVIEKIAKWIAAIILIPVVYFLLSLILTFIPVNKVDDNDSGNKSIYLSSNGVHLDIIIAKNRLDPKLLDGLKYSRNDHYFAFGWGDKNFYLHTPTWDDLTFNNASRAVLMSSPAAIHLTRYSKSRGNWVEIKVNQNQLDKINGYINKTFDLDSINQKILLPNRGYADNDDFYEALGNFTCFKTCNTWVNSRLKESDIKACLWTPFDFGLLHMHNK